MDNQNNDVEIKKVHNDLLVYKVISLVVFLFLALAIIYIVDLLNNPQSSVTGQTTSSQSVTSTIPSQPQVPVVSSSADLNSALNYLNNTHLSSITSGISQNTLQ
ncbi:MAG: hypothetical protein ACYDAS_00340 [Patescibacteria group bacterium]